MTVRRDSGDVAAFFDLDGTLIPEPSLERRFFRELRRNGWIPPMNYLRWCSEALRLLPKGLSAVRYSNKRYLKGLCLDCSFRHGGTISFFDEGIARVGRHAELGHAIVLLTGTLETLAGLAASSLECELEGRGLQVRVHICATQLEEENGRWTGAIVGEALCGQEKARRIENFAKDRGIDLRRSYGYANDQTDRFFLLSVGHPHAVNPDRKLEALARKDNWPIWRWRVENRVDSSATERFAENNCQIEEPA
jgi:phosphoserine phosphatase